MANQPTTSAKNVTGDFDTFTDFARRLFAVPHSHIKAKLEAEKAVKRTPKSASRVPAGSDHLPKNFGLQSFALHIGNDLRPDFTRFTVQHPHDGNFLAGFLAILFSQAAFIVHLPRIRANESFINLYGAARRAQLNE